MDRGKICKAEELLSFIRTLQMPLQQHAQKFVDEFFQIVSEVEDAYLNSSCSYVAIKSGEDFIVLHAKVFLNPKLTNAPLSHFQSESVRAGHFRLSDLQLDHRKIVEELLSGKLPTPQGDILFPAPDGGSHGASYIPFHPDGLQVQKRISVLRIFGSQPHLLRRSDVDWDIKASDTPYDGLQELMQEYLLGPILETPIHVEIAAFCLAEIDTSRSIVIGDKAKFFVLAAAGADTREVKVGYRVVSQGRASVRSMLANASITWTANDGVQSGEATIDVPIAAVVNAVVSYNGLAQHHWWFVDPTTSQNSRRAVYEAFDPNSATLKDILAKAQGKSQEARQLESAVGWLLWMLGFAVAHLGGTPRTQDAVDLIATTPGGHFAVVECTTGLLKAENKLPLLHDRAEAVRRALAASNQAHLHVVPIIVTTKTRDEIKPDVEQAERLGILAVTRDEFESIMIRSLLLPNADRLYEEIEELVRTTRAKYDLQQIGTVLDQSSFD